MIKADGDGERGSSTPMKDSDPIAEGSRTLGRHLAMLRRAAGHTQSTLAPLIHYHRSTIANVETGRQRVDRAFWARCDELLNTGGVLTRQYEQINSTARQRVMAMHTPHDERLLAPLRRQLLSPAARDAPGDHLAVPDVRRRVAQTHIAYQRADYCTAARLLPDVLADADQVVRRPGAQGRQAHALLAAANLAASKLAVKLGDESLAWVTADRAGRSAAVANEPCLGAAAAYSVASALLAMPNRDDEAADVIAAALDAAAGGRTGQASPTVVSVQGALTLLAAIVAAGRGRHGEAKSHLGAAARLADRLDGDRNKLWTGFGPTNVLIHGLSIAARHQPQHAIELGQQLDASRMPQPLVGRRTQVHLDLAAAFAARTNRDASAVLHLLEAERLAPQVFRLHQPTRGLVGDLLRRERRAATPGLRSLAERAGLAA